VTQFDASAASGLRAGFFGVRTHPFCHESEIYRSFEKSSSKAHPILGLFLDGH